MFPSLSKSPKAAPREDLGINKIAAELPRDFLELPAAGIAIEFFALRVMLARFDAIDLRINVTVGDKDIG